MAYENILVEIADRIAAVTINRPKSLNALDPPTMRELKEALTEIAGRSDVGVVLLTGAGEKAFVAGADISALKDRTTMEALEFATFGQGVLEQIERLPQPVIGVINGFALGGGCELAMACDILIAAESAKFGQPEVTLGIIPGYGGTQRLPRLVGRNIAKEMVLAGEMIDARRAFEIGLVNKVVPAKELMAAARELAGKILAKAPLAVRTAKMAMNRGLEMDLPNGCALEAALFAAGFSTRDKEEGVSAFLEKRKPVFTGK